MIDVYEFTLANAVNGMLYEFKNSAGDVTKITAHWGRVGGKEGGAASVLNWAELREKYPQIAAAERESMEAKAIRLTSPRAEVAHRGV